jgi:hypothetical protein
MSWSLGAAQDTATVSLAHEGGGWLAFGVPATPGQMVVSAAAGSVGWQLGGWAGPTCLVRTRGGLPYPTSLLVTKY